MWLVSALNFIALELNEAMFWHNLVLKLKVELKYDSYSALVSFYILVNVENMSFLIKF